MSRLFDRFWLTKVIHINLELFRCRLEVWEVRIVRIAVLEILITLYIKAWQVSTRSLIELLTV